MWVSRKHKKMEVKVRYWRSVSSSIFFFIFKKQKEVHGNYFVGYNEYWEINKYLYFV